MSNCFLAAIFFAIIFIPIFGEDVGAQAWAADDVDSVVTLHMNNGDILTGVVIAEDSESLTIRTLKDYEITVRKKNLLRVISNEGVDRKYRFQRIDRNYSRLMLAPTGRPLRRGDGYFSNAYVLFPGIALGVTDNITILAGISIIPGLDLDQQLLYFAPKIGHRFGDNFSFSVGAAYATVGEDFTAGMIFAVGTVGPDHAAFTGGIGLGYAGEGDDVKFADNPVIMFGGNLRMSNSVALVSENWMATGENFDLNEQPFGIAIRFFGERLSADFGFLLIGEVLEAGFPIPWLSMTYNFGPSDSFRGH